MGGHDPRRLPWAATVCGGVALGRTERERPVKGKLKEVNLRLYFHPLEGHPNPRGFQDM